MVICASTSATNKAQQQFEANRWMKNISEIVFVHQTFLQRQHALKKMFLTKHCLTLKRPSTKNNAYFITRKSRVQKLLSFLQHTCSAHSSHSVQFFVTYFSPSTFNFADDTLTPPVVLNQLAGHHCVASSKCIGPSMINLLATSSTRYVIVMKLSHVQGSCSDMFVSKRAFEWLPLTG